MTGKGSGEFLDFGQAYRKAADYCAYQDRCISEIRLKLKTWNIDSSFTGKIISKLQEEDFLNEKRFALNYAGGKFRINGWGKLKISAGLRAKSIQPLLITLALSALDDNEYNAYLSILLQKKLMQLGSNTPQNRQKAAWFAASRGFETGIIATLLKDNDLLNFINTNNP